VRICLSFLVRSVTLSLALEAMRSVKRGGSVSYRPPNQNEASFIELIYVQPRSDLHNSQHWLTPKLPSFPAFRDEIVRSGGGHADQDFGWQGIRSVI
jgi:hypothetical protein